MFVSAWAGTSVRSVSADDFRVENQVFLGKEKEPVSRSTTIFHEGVVYDYMQEPSEAIVFDKAAGRFILLDMARRMQSELTTEQVATFAERLRRTAGAQEDPFLQFLAAPKFDEQFDKEAGSLSLTSPWMTYRLLLVDAGSPAIAQQYREFSDWYARLNSMLHPGSKPPFARLLLNEALVRYTVVPREVELTVTPKKSFPPKKTTFRSRHELARRVAQSDLDRVTQTREFMAIFQRVAFEQYRKKP